MLDAFGYFWNLSRGNSNWRLGHGFHRAWATSMSKRRAMSRNRHHDDTDFDDEKKSVISLSRADIFKTFKLKGL